MAKLKILNKVNGFGLLEPYGLGAIKVNLDDVPGKIRFLCSCGEVSNGDVCPYCGMTTDLTVSRGWGWGSRTTDLLVKRKEELVSTSLNEIAFQTLRILIDFTSNEFELYEQNEVCCTFSDDGKINQKCQLTYEQLDNAVNQHPEWFTETVLDLWSNTKNVIETAYEGECPGVSLIHNFSTNINLPKEQYVKYRPLFKNAIRSSHYNYSSVKLLTTITDIKDLLKFLNIPVEFLDFFEICSETIYSLPQKKMNIINEFLGVFRHSLIHKQLSFNETLNIMTDLEKYPTEVQKEFLEFYIKNVSMHRQNVFRNFLSIKDKATTYKMTDLDTKRLSKVHIQNYLKSKKVNETRAERAFDVFDIDPLLTLDLLSSTGKLSTDEMNAVMKKL